MNEPVADPDVERLKAAAATLREHFDTVHIFVTRVEDDAQPDERLSTSVQFGSGNWFARYGQVRQWLIKNDEATRQKTRGTMQEGEE